jgi:hypothetical protein
MLSLLVTLIASVTVQSDTSVILGTVQRDLTGDGNSEILRLVGVGPTPDSLHVTFSIESSGRIIYQLALAPLTRTVGFDAGRRRLSTAEHRQRLREFGSWFFDEPKFKQPSAFLRSLYDSAPLHVAEIPAVIARDGGFPSDSSRGAAIWSEIQQRGVPIFEFSPGGDAWFAVAWSERDGRFYRLVECC